MPCRRRRSAKARMPAGGAGGAGGGAGGPCAPPGRPCRSGRPRRSACGPWRALACGAPHAARRRRRGPATRLRAGAGGDARALARAAAGAPRACLRAAPTAHKLFGQGHGVARIPDIARAAQLRNGALCEAHGPWRGPWPGRRMRGSPFCAAVPAGRRDGHAARQACHVSRVRVGYMGHQASRRAPGSHLEFRWRRAGPQVRVRGVLRLRAAPRPRRLGGAPPPHDRRPLRLRARRRGALCGGACPRAGASRPGTCPSASGVAWPRQAARRRNAGQSRECPSAWPEAWRRQASGTCGEARSSTLRHRPPGPACPRAAALGKGRGASPGPASRLLAEHVGVGGLDGAAAVAARTGQAPGPAVAKAGIADNQARRRRSNERRAQGMVEGVRGGVAPASRPP